MINEEDFTGESSKVTVEVDGYDVDIYRNGKVEMATSSGGNPQKEEKLAKKILVVNPDGNEDYEKSPYVTYNNIKCRVLYNDDEHGLQIISTEDMPDRVTLGSDYDFYKAKNDYNSVVTILNEEANKYRSETDKIDGTDENKIAIDARCLGSIATLNENERFKGDITTEVDSLGFKIEDENYKEDADETTGQLKKIGMTINSGVWLASRRLKSASSNSMFYVRRINRFSEELFGSMSWVMSMQVEVTFTNHRRLVLGLFFLSHLK